MNEAQLEKARELIREIQRIAEEESPYPEGDTEQWEALQRRENLIEELHVLLTGSHS